MSPSRAAAPFAGLSVERETTVDRVLTELRRAIFEGELAPGTPLREIALAETLGVARSTVREALSMLVAEGIAVRVPNKGTAVRAPSVEAIRDVTVARTVLETAGVRAWTDAPEARREEVRRRLATYATLAADAPTNSALNEAHLAFHRALVGLTGSERLVATQESLSAEIRLTLATVNRSKRDAREQVASHSALVDLLEAGDIETAVAEIVRHVADGCDSMLTELEPGPA